jgi:hypothetical protein
MHAHSLTGNGRLCTYTTVQRIKAWADGDVGDEARGGRVYNISAITIRHNVGASAPRRILTSVPRHNERGCESYESEEGTDGG